MANWSRGIGDALSYLGDYFMNQDMVKKRMEMQRELSSQEDLDRISRDIREFNLWTNPDDPARALLASRYPGLDLPTAKFRPDQFMRFKSPGGNTGGGGFNFSAPSSNSGGGLPSSNW